jgi:site-specific DNA recombinase
MSTITDTPLDDLDGPGGFPAGGTPVHQPPGPVADRRPLDSGQIPTTDDGPPRNEDQPALAAYVRVSTTKQADEGYSLDVQRDAITTWATNRGFRIDTWHEDEVSASVDDRPGLFDALALVRDPTSPVTGIVVYRLDRFARDVILQETLLRDLTDHGGTLHSCDDEESRLLADPNDPTRELVRTILGALKKYEVKVLKQRTLAGRRRKHAQGGHAWGPPPFGFRIEDGRLVPVPSEQDTIRRARELRLTHTLREVGLILAAENRPPRSGGRWHPSAVARLIRSELVPT